MFLLLFLISKKIKHFFSANLGFLCYWRLILLQTTTLIKVENRLINVSPTKEHKRILDICEPVDMVLGTILSEPDKSYPYVYFPLTGSISLETPIKGHPSLKVALIGNEGMLGATLVLGVNNSRLRSVVQGSGTALRTTPTKLLCELRNSPILLGTIKRYLYVLMMQQSQSIACSCFHEVRARLARWLLMTHDRAHADHFHLTHQFLADMLGVQRSAISIAAGKLQRKNLIRYSRGDIFVLNRSGLEAASCECYDVLIEDYAQLFS